jgi:hypothetical protein
MVQQFVDLIPIKVPNGYDMSRFLPSRFVRTIIGCSCSNYLSLDEMAGWHNEIRNHEHFVFSYRNDIYPIITHFY